MSSAPSPAARRPGRALRPLAIAALFALICSSASGAQDGKHDFLLRFPDVHGGSVVFVAGEDIWLAPVQGGVATRLTINDGEELYPKFSPDGSLIAFTGSYDGNADVYVMDTLGGNITRVTFHPDYDTVVGWDDATGKIMFTSTRNSFQGFTRLFLIRPDGTGLEEVPLPEVAQASFSPDGKRIAFCKVSVDSRTWKRYRGGLAPDVYVYDFATKRETNISNSNAIDSNPMWIGDKVYFTSDRDRVLNVWSYDASTTKLEQLTTYTEKEYDVRRPSMGGSRIVYELGGDLFLLDTAAKTTARIPIVVGADAPELRPYLKKVDGYLTDVSCSPDGATALLVARGDIFTVPREKGITRDLTETSGIRERGAVWSPDGATIAYLSDADGEYDLYTVDAAGAEQPRRLTHFADGYRHTLRWSPDGKRIAFTDQTLTLYVIDVSTGTIAKVDKADFENVDISLDLKDIYDFAWSPDSRFIAYAKMDSSLVDKIYIYALETGRTRCISEGEFNDFHPLFSRDGEHLFFISNRRFDPTFGDFQWEMVYKKLAGIYSYTLRRDGPALFPAIPAAEGAAPAAAARDARGAAKNGGTAAKREKAGAKPPLVTIDFDGLNRRVETFPLPRGNYRRLAANDEALFYLDADEGDFNRFEFRDVGPRKLCAFSFKDKQQGTVIDGVDRYDLSADGSTIVYAKDGAVGMIDASARDSKGESISLEDVTMMLDPLSEWRQIFAESWRMERDFYYDPNMHGLDWAAMRVKYGRMLDRVTCRQDVQYVIGELIGELNTSHTYVFGGDVERRAERVGVGLLGADYEVDAANGLYRFKKIYGETDWNGDERPPLVGPGIAVREGDYLLEVDGREVTTQRSIYSSFIDLAGKPVEITVNDKPTTRGARTVVVKPVGSEFSLRYMDWVEGNRRFVEQASGGEIGYLHLPDTYTGSTAIFPRYFYSQTTKKGIVVDGRFNRGGLDPDIFLERLDKRPLLYWTRRHSHDYVSPWFATNAHLVCLTNRQAGSGGDMLPYLFREKAMGPVIGTRSWGGLVGVSMWIGMVDGGGLSAPDYRVYSPDGKWVVENEGVDPDITVDLDPADFGTGRDAQLATAIEVLMKKIREEPRPWPRHEEFPVDR
jgi:tricorn protease